MTLKRVKNTFIINNETRSQLEQIIIKGINKQICVIRYMEQGREERIVYYSPKDKQMENLSTEGLRHVKDEQLIQ